MRFALLRVAEAVCNRRTLSAYSEEFDAAKASITNQHVVDFGHKGPHDGMLELWVDCELPLEAPRVLFVPLLEEMAKSVCVKSTPGIHAAVALPADKLIKVPFVQTAGVNFEVLALYDDIVDLPAVKSNHIHAVLQFFGVEAARAAIVNEIDSVFAVYGISVDRRHLGLIADYMTHEGSYKALNRHGRLT